MQLLTKLTSQFSKFRLQLFNSIQSFIFNPFTGSDENSLGTTDPSEGSFGEGESLLDDSHWGNAGTLEELEQLNQQLSKHGPPQSEKELR